MLRQAVGGQAITLPVKSPSEVLAAVAPSSQGAAALHPHYGPQPVQAYS